MSNTKHFLSRNGKIFGPFETPEFDKMKVSGSLKEYHWIWSENNSSWEPLDPAPQMTPQQFLKSGGNTTPSAASSVSGKSERSRSKSPGGTSILYDHSHAVSGLIIDETELGFTMESTDHISEPYFQSGQRLDCMRVNSKQQCQAQKVIISEMQYTEGKWQYKVYF